MILHWNIHIHLGTKHPPPWVLANFKFFIWNNSTPSPVVLRWGNDAGVHLTHWKTGGCGCRCCWMAKRVPVRGAVNKKPYPWWMPGRGGQSDIKVLPCMNLELNFIAFSRTPTSGKIYPFQGEFLKWYIFQLGYNFLTHPFQGYKFLTHPF